jgi:hypothetical protein
MTRQDALAFIDDQLALAHNALDTEYWRWLRAIVANITNEEWERAVDKAIPALVR